MNVVKTAYGYLAVRIICPAKLFVIEKDVQIKIKN